MPDSLPPDARRRLGIVLALLASDQDGEALNAARMAVKLLAKHGLRPEHLVDLTGGQNAAHMELAALRAENRMLRAALERLRAGARSRSAEPPQGNDEDAITDAAAFAADLLARAAGLTERERAFLQDLVDKDWGRATEKQASWLRNIAKKIPTAGERNGTWP